MVLKQENEKVCFIRARFCSRRAVFWPSGREEGRDDRTGNWASNMAAAVLGTEAACHRDTEGTLLSVSLDLQKA